MMYDYHVTADSFGADCPENWEEIADFLNDMIDAALEATDGVFDPAHDEIGLSPEGHDVVNDIWERYCAGQIDGAPLPA